MLIARIYEVFPLLCPLCGRQMRLIAFITHSADIRQILEHIGVGSKPPHIAPARGPPLWEDGDVQIDDGAQIEPDWDLAAHPGSDHDEVSLEQFTRLMDGDGLAWLGAGRRTGFTMASRRVMPRWWPPAGWWW